MNREHRFLGTLVCVTFAFAGPINAQPTGKPVRGVRTVREQNAAILKILDNRVDTSKLQDVPLKDALEYYSDFLRARAIDLKTSDGKEPLFVEGIIPVLLDVATFREFAGPSPPPETDPYVEKITLTERSMPLSLALRLTLGQVAKGQATFLVRQGHLLVAPAPLSSANHLLNRSSLFLSVQERTLPDVLQDFTDETGLAINIDPNVGQKANTQITATFRSTSVEDALVTVTEMAGLKFVVFERSVFVTTPDRVDVLRKEEKERSKNRKEFDPKIKRLEPAL